MKKLLGFLFFVIVLIVFLTIRLRDMGGVIYSGPKAENKQIWVTEHTNGQRLKITVDGVLVYNGIIERSSRYPLITRVPVPRSSGIESVVRIHGDFPEIDTLINWNEYDSVIIGIGKTKLSVYFTNDPIFL